MSQSLEFGKLLFAKSLLLKPTETEIEVFCEGTGTVLTNREDKPRNVKNERSATTAALTTLAVALPEPRKNATYIERSAKATAPSRANGSNSPSGGKRCWATSVGNTVVIIGKAVTIAAKTPNMLLNDL